LQTIANITASGITEYKASEHIIVINN